MFIEILKTIVIGIVQGITEWLPISSTGHIKLLDEFLKLQVSTEFKDMFDVVIQFGSILAVVILYFNKLNPFAPSKSQLERKNTWTIWFKVLVATVPTAIAGLLFDDIIDGYLNTPFVIATALFIYGIAFIVIERLNKGKIAKYETVYDITYMTAFLIGAVQILALIPGTSRSGSTIIGAILLGCSRVAGAEFSFFLAIPVMFGASLLKLVKFFAETGLAFSVSEFVILITGMITAFVVSVIAIKFLMDYIRKKDFAVFGWYRIVLAVIVLAYFMIKA